MVDTGVSTRPRESNPQTGTGNDQPKRGPLKTKSNKPVKKPLDSDSFGRGGALGRTSGGRSLYPDPHLKTPFILSAGTGVVTDHPLVPYLFIRLFMN